MPGESHLVIYLIGSRQMVERLRHTLRPMKAVSNLIPIVVGGKDKETDSAVPPQKPDPPARPNSPLTLIFTDTALEKVELWNLCRQWGLSLKHPSLTPVVRVGTKGKGGIRVSARCKPCDLRVIVSLLRKNLELTRFLRKKRWLVRSLHSLASRDPLTGLANRRGWKITIKQLWREAGEKAYYLLVALFDLDGFKKVNDQFGHAFGDEVLKSVAQKAQEACRKGDLLARWGGDEFALAVILPDKSVALQLVERVRSSLQAVFPPMETPVTASAGYIVIQPRAAWHDEFEEHLLQCADAALAQAKTSPGHVLCAETGGLSIVAKNE
ncbi:MAG: GGDEF domain-containing protein [Thermogutta sp.]